MYIGKYMYVWMYKDMYVCNIKEQSKIKSIIFVGTNSGICDRKREPDGGKC